MKWMHILYEGILDVIFPKRCVSCNVCLDDNEKAFCESCFVSVDQVNPPFCKMCGIPVSQNSIKSICDRCVEQKCNFDRLNTVYCFGGSVARAIHKMKYTKNPHFASQLGPFLYDCLNYLKKKDVIVPVPLHNARKMQRGYNQSFLLAYYLKKVIPKEFKITLNSKHLVRSINTLTQVDLPMTERLLNVEGAFKVKKGHPFKNKRIILVDDVVTTGSTVNECAKELKKAGASFVHVITLAFTPQ